MNGSDKNGAESGNLCDKGGGLVVVCALQLNRHNVCKLLCNVGIDSVNWVNNFDVFILHVVWCGLAADVHYLRTAASHFGSLGIYLVSVLPVGSRVHDGFRGTRGIHAERNSQGVCTLLVLYSTSCKLVVAECTVENVCRPMTISYWPVGTAESEKVPPFAYWPVARLGLELHLR